MYSLYSELLPPSGVDLAIACDFVSINNIVLAKGNLLQVYAINPTRQTESALPSAYIYLLHEFNLNGTVCSMQSASLPGSRLDCLILSFKDAKLSIVEFSQQTQSLQTVSIHLYEKEEFRAESQTYKEIPVIRIDPLCRICLTSFYGKYFSILPFHKGVTDEKPFLPSFVMKHSDIAGDVRNIVDFTFLHGYLEPTLAILYEPTQTWVGRLASAKDTFSVIVVSVDVSQKMFPVLYKIDGLPYNCTHIKPVPKPLGGLLVFSHNSLIYMDQATPAPGLACVVNYFFDAETRLRSMPGSEETPLPPVKQQPPSVFYKTGRVTELKDLGISLDGSSSVFLSPDILLITLRNGDMYQVDLVGDFGIGRSWKRRRGGIKKFEFKAIGMRLMRASCLVPLPAVSGNWDEMGYKYRYGFFFAASQVADCYLIQYVECEEAGKETSKMDLDDIDAELYGDSKNVGDDMHELPPIRFRICDSLLVTAPIRDMTVGQPANYSSHPYQGDSTALEVVACTGEGLDGSLTILHNSVLPKILSSFELNDVTDLWSIKVSPNEENSYHKYLILSRNAATSVLKTGEEFEEFEKSEFYQSGPTIGVGTLQNESIICQVYGKGIVILDGDGQKLSEMTLESSDEKILSCDICDPYISILQQNKLTILKWDFNGLQTIYNEMEDMISIAVLYKDTSNTMLRQKDISHAFKNERTADKDVLSSNEDAVGDESDLYGDDDDLYGKDQDKPEKLVAREPGMRVEILDAQNFWVFVYKKNGSLMVFSLPDYTLCFSTDRFDTAPALAVDTISQIGSNDQIQYDLEEMLIMNLGASPAVEAPFLIARSNKLDLFIYKIIPDLFTSRGADRLAIRLARIPQSHISREPLNFTDTEGDKMHPIFNNSRSCKSFFKPFRHIGLADGMSYSGVVLTGARPCWIMMAESGGSMANLKPLSEESSGRLLPTLSSHGTNFIRVHPMLVDGPLKTFAPLNNINSPFGFVYMNSKGSFRVAQLPAQFNYDHNWACCKVPLNRCTQKIKYHTASQTHVLATSTDASFTLMQARYDAAVAAGVIVDGDELPEAEKKLGEAEQVERLPGMNAPNFQQYQLELVSPVTWETVDIFQLQYCEQVLCVHSAALSSTETKSGRKQYMAVGTSYLRSEELACRGRILLFEIIEVVPEPGNPQTNHKFKLFCKTDEKAPVTALCGVNGCLLAALGTKIIMYNMEEGELNGIAFLDVNIFVVSVSAVKNLILIGDVFKSVWFVVFQEDPPKMIDLGKDHYPVQVYGTDFLVDNALLAMIVTDSNRNMHVLTYSPYAVQSQGGKRLIRRGEIHTGQHIQSFIKIRCHPTFYQNEWVQSGQYAAIGGTLSGGIVMVLPVSEKMFKRLYSLYSRMVTHLEHNCGLNPRGFRHVVNNTKTVAVTSVVSGLPGPRGVLDGELIKQFAQLPLSKQQELAVAIGSRPDRIMDDLLDVERSIEYF